MKILFVCDSNVRRSQICAVIGEIKHPSHQFKSVGLSDAYIGASVPAATIEQAEKILGIEYGNKLRDRFSKPISDGFVGWADVIFVMDDTEKEMILSRRWRSILSSGTVRVLSQYVGAGKYVDVGERIQDLEKMVDMAVTKLEGEKIEKVV